MRKSWLLTLLAAAVLLTACGQTAAPADESTPTAAVDAAAVPTKIATPEGEPMACTPYSLLPNPSDPASLNLPAINADDWSRGPQDASMTIVIYSDFQCPACSEAGPALRQLEEENPERVRVIYRHYPLEQHDKALLAAQAAEAAGLQGKFWEMHDFLFSAEQWSTWTALTAAEFPDWISTHVADLGLDADQFTQDLTSADVVAAVQADLADGHKIGLFQTPTLFLFLDGELIFTHNEALTYDPKTLKLILDVVDLRAKQYDACPPVITDPSKSYTATIQTEIGDIKIKLFADKAPLAVNSFVFLSKMGFYDNVPFHRVLSGALAQAGDPSGTGIGGPGYQFVNEISADLKYDQAGMVGMANSGADTNGSQFFITFTEMPSLDGSYTIFGQVIAGLDVAEQLTPRDPADTTTPLPDGTLIKTILIEEQ